MRVTSRERPLVAAALMLGVATALTIWTLQRAFGATNHSVPAPVSASLALPPVPDREPVASALLDEIVSHDLFHPERRRPTVPFRRPSEIAAARAPVASPVASPAPLRLLGTVLSGAKDAFVVCQLGSEAPHVVRAGGTIGSYTLRKIEPGRALFTSPSGETTDLRVTKAGP